MVADHAKRAISTFPAATGPYYGIDYPARRDLDTRPDSPRRVPGDRLDWPRNIPVPTSYMCLGSQEDFFGGYDHRAGAGFVHWADHRYAVGKKQWTWGDADFGHAWDRNLADDGVDLHRTDGRRLHRQPARLLPPRAGRDQDLLPVLVPVAGTGPAVAANLDVAPSESTCGPERTTLRFDATRQLGAR